MDSPEYDSLGFYEPGFLHLRVNSDKKLENLNDLLLNDPEVFSTFLHEYIHFLQNITTTTGLHDSILWIDAIKHVNWEVRNDPNQKFETPFKFDDSSNVKANLALREIYRGDATQVDYILYRRFSVSQVQQRDKDGNPFLVNKYAVHYTNGKRRTDSTLHFGFACLKEYVAHAVQSRFGFEPVHPDIPYKVPELILNVEYPQFGGDPMLIAALCDSALMSYHPAQMFFETISRMRTERFVPSTALEVYEFVYKEVKFVSRDRSETIESLFTNGMVDASNQFFDALQSEPLKPNHTWLQFILYAASIIRFEHPDFMTRLVDDKGKPSSLFFMISKFIGTPLFTNKTFHGYFSPPYNLNVDEVRPYMSIAFKAVLDVYQGNEGCSLYKFCKTKPGEDLTNEKCQTVPWERATDPMLCPFGQLWHAWGLVGKVPVRIVKK